MIPVGIMQSNCYILQGDENCIIIDPGDEADFITQTISKLRLKPVSIISTHGHFDHNLAAFEISSNFNIPFYLQSKDIFLVKNMSKSAKSMAKKERYINP